MEAFLMRLKRVLRVARRVRILQHLVDQVEAVSGHGAALAQLTAACGNVACCFFQSSDEEDEKLP